MKGSAMEALSAPSFDLALLKSTFLRLLPESEHVSASIVSSLETRGLIESPFDGDEFHLALWLALAQALDRQSKGSESSQPQQKLLLILQKLGVPACSIKDAARSLAQNLSGNEVEATEWNKFLDYQLDSLSVESTRPAGQLGTS